MPEPFAKPTQPNADRVVSVLEKGSRARQCLQLGVGDDLSRRRDAIYRQAETELRGGTLTPDRAFMHVACANALRRYAEELQGDIEKAQSAAEQLHSEPPDDGGTLSPAEGA